MEAEFWHKRWDSCQIGFNQQAAHRYLEKHWSDLSLEPGSAVFVPLCGKTTDMVWLAEQGHRVIGIELSPIAIAEFFSEQGLAPEVRTHGPFTASTFGPYELWCGDVFDLSAAELVDVAAVYDRASLVALPPDMRGRYAEHLTEIVPAAAPIFLVSFEYDQSEMDGPPHSVTGDEIGTRFEANFDVTPLAHESVISNSAPMRERGLTELYESLVILTRS